MAYGYECGLGDQPHEADYILTSIRNGQTTAFCAEDSPVALIGALAVELGVEAGELYEAVKAFVDAKAEAERQAAVAELHKHGQAVPRPGARRRKPRETVTGGAALSPELQGDGDGQADGDPEAGHAKTGSGHG